MDNLQLQAENFVGLAFGGSRVNVYEISYRAIKEPNSLVRRLRYLSQILRLVEARPLNRDILAVKLRDWSSIHAGHLNIII